MSSPEPVSAESPATPEEAPRDTTPVEPGGDDALCFAAGMTGTPFGAGVIHAYLTADRPPPQAVAGISTGALTAAVMWLSYRETQAHARFARGEPRRWSRLRQYVTLLSEDPYRVLWNALPNQSDFFIDLPPLEDRTVPKRLRQDERRAARSRHHHVLLGRWLAGLPLRGDHLADLMEGYVHLKEQKAPSRLAQLRWSLRCIRDVLPVLFYAAFHPMRFPADATLWTSSAEASGPPPSPADASPPAPRRPPLIGWLPYLAISLVVALIAAGLFGVASGVLLGVAAGAFHQPWASPGLAGGLLIGGTSLLGILLLGSTLLLRGLAFGPSSKEESGPSPFLNSFLEGSNLTRSLLDDFHLRLALHRLFTEPEREDEVPDVQLTHAPRPLLVAAPLQTLKRSATSRSLVAQQLWATQGPIVDALRAALASPPLFAPVRLESDDLKAHWLDKGATPDNGGPLDLVDGSVIRQNPLPALLKFIQRNPETRSPLSTSSERPGIHVVYSVPIESADGTNARPVDDQTDNIVDVGLLSLRLAQRLDTRLEVGLTNFISNLETLIPPSSEPSRGTVPVFVDEIAPAPQHITFENPLSPSKPEVLQAIAGGCQRTLETLYSRELREQVGAASAIPCNAFLGTLKTRRDLGSVDPAAPGLPEVCGRCTRMLRPRDRTEPLGIPEPVTPSVAAAAPSPQPPAPPAALVPAAESSGEWKPRIVFVASGGVFRGAFHIGMAAALTEVRIKPDIIVGASVGSLIGAALAKMFYNQHKGDDAAVTRLLGDMVGLFLRVDERVALTQPLLSTVREVKSRLARVKLSPARITHLVRQGIRSDLGYTILGAPPQLIEAISNVFLLPHQDTRDIAAEFLAGHVTESVDLLARKVRKETLVRLGISHAVMGASLLERAVRDILSGQGWPIALDQRQPFLEAGIEFYCTATDLSTYESLILGTEQKYAGRPYDFVEACLASSAFPSVFAPRRESDVFPGSGRREVRLADGGLFDNLPFSHGINVLERKQRAWRQAHPETTPLAFLEKRSKARHLFLVGALNVNPEASSFPEHGKDHLLATSSRAGSLKDNVKIRAFEGASLRVRGQVGRLLKAPPRELSAGQQDFIDEIVDPLVLPVFPASHAHLNGTFAFSRSMGLEGDRVRRSIADGCFQTLRQVASPQNVLDDGTQANLADLQRTGRIPEIVRKPQPRPAGAESASLCPFFKKGHEDIVCPFARKAAGTDLSQVMGICRKDPQHRAALG
ncbi:patatin-like phospholipase family protein [Hyalangium gracile]|uniref:patatin-like phospholipase family protein n=1 Tax=Hyalangium gracile TaxID=394092 RepID=UPI001CCDEC8B|nr:patatin-like phospholipase family protein [Hyalangium gracile]